MGSGSRCTWTASRSETMTQSVVDHAQFPVNQIGAAVAAAPGAWPAYGTAGGEYFTGQIDEVALYSHPLNARRSSAHWQQGRNAADQLTSITSAGGRTTAEIEYNPARTACRGTSTQNGGAWTIGDPRVIGNDKDLRPIVRGHRPGPTLVRLRVRRARRMAAAYRPAARRGHAASRPDCRHAHRTGRTPDTRSAATPTTRPVS